MKKRYWALAREWDDGMPWLQRRIANWIKRKGYLRSLRPGYGFMFSARQLKFLLNCVDETAEVPGAVVEVGCAYGATTIFLYEYLRDSGIRKQYVCIDTFAGFTEADIDYEVEKRGKQFEYSEAFPNNVRWFRETLGERKIRDVEIIEADINELDVAALPEEISFCLLDVDRYRPVASGLEKLFPRLAAGGLIVVDDCWIDAEHFHASLPDMYDGALFAYREFTSSHGIPEEFAEKKLGVIRKRGAR